MKIAIITDHLPGYHTVWSGAEVMAVKIRELLQGVGAEVQLVTTTFDSDINHNLGDDIRVVRAPLKRYEVALANFPVDRDTLRDMHSVLKRYGPDVVHINGHYLYLPAVLVSAWLRIPCVYTVADYWLFCPRTFIRKPNGDTCTQYHGPGCLGCMAEMKVGPVKRVLRWVPPCLLRLCFWARRAVYSYANVLVRSYVALTEASCQRLIEYGIPAKRVRVIYPYALAEPSATYVRLVPMSVVFVGWLSVENGVDVLVRAFLRVGLPEARLYLVGTGKDKFVDTLQQMTDERVVFLGKRHNAEALSIMQQCRVVAVMHQWPKEFGPVVLIEAAALGKPVVTSKIGATEEFVQDGVSGYLIEDYRNPEAVAVKLRELLLAPDKAAAMGAAGAGRMGFVRDGAAARKLLDLYKEVSCR